MYIEFVKICRLDFGVKNVLTFEGSRKTNFLDQANYPTFIQPVG